ncbi:hypothetical protein H4217_004642 [Coemansia sp. RSA 1939]|nr:hypothetical protein H4217_004642 [Coemansia sp. RSA 1939]KAJ2608460.1 hypothetical protein EV177_004965 [Coemansia sp. RSA 1804]KAJ2691740.1 hypothetical protein GGH99_002198 [Coemansia sp. RSA 1285]
MGTVPTKSQKPSSFIYAWAVLAGTAFWSFAIAVPRALSNAALRILDRFEDVMLNILWDYQGENILHFLYKHQQSKAKDGSGDDSIGRVRINGKMLSMRVAGNLQSTGVQTDDCTMSLGVREREKRNNLMDKILEDLVPALLQVLHSVPQKSELEAMYREQVALIQTVQQSAHGVENTSLLLASDTGNDKDCQMQMMSRSQDIGKALQDLANRVGAVDDHVVQVLQELESEERESVFASERLDVLVEGLGAVREKCEADKALALHMMQSLERMGTTLASAIATTATKPLCFDTNVYQSNNNNNDDDDNDSDNNGSAQATPPQTDAATGEHVVASPANSSHSAMLSRVCSAQYNTEYDYNSDSARSAIADYNASFASNTRAQSISKSVMSASSAAEVGCVVSSSNPLGLKRISTDAVPGQIPQRDTSGVTLLRTTSVLGSAVTDALAQPAKDTNSKHKGAELKGAAAFKDGASALGSHSANKIHRKFSLRREIKRHSWFGKKPE